MMRSKRILKCLFAILFCCITSVRSLAESRTYMNIKTLAEQSADRWQGEYQSVRGETVSVDCPVIVPDADIAPVLRVIWYPPLDQAFLQEFKAPSKADEYKYTARSNVNTTVFFSNFSHVITPENAKKCTFATEFVPLKEVDWDKAYARNNPLTAREAFGVIEERTKEICEKYGKYGYYPMAPAYNFTVFHLTDMDGNPLRDIAAYDFTGHEVIRGLPVLGNVPFNYGSINNHEFESLNEAQYYILYVESESAYGVAAHLLAEEELIHEDIPLVDFEIAKPQIEKLIEDGRVRKVHGVRLGYILYLEPDHSHKHFRLIPSWVVECDYYPSAKVETEVTDIPNYIATQYFRRLVINSQTGKLLDPENKSLDRSDYPDIITWDQVK